MTPKYMKMPTLSEVTWLTKGALGGFYINVGADASEAPPVLKPPHVVIPLSFSGRTSLLPCLYLIIVKKI